MIKKVGYLKHSFKILLTIIIFITSFLLSRDHRAYEVLYVDIQTKFTNSEIRVFKTKELDLYTDYKILSENFRLRIIDQPVWGFCFKI